MLRAVLVGLLAMSAVGCKSGGDAPASQPGVAAGKVVEVTGTVTLRHDDVVRPLAKGETVEGDDVVETGADGNVIIELAHNLARWELGANRTSKVRESVAWSLPKKTGEAANVEQTSAAAGRHAERSAAETSVSASATEAAAAPPAAPAPAAAAPPAPTRAPVAAAAPAEPAAGGPTPPPAPARRREAAEKKALGIGDVRLDAKSGGGAVGGGGNTRGGGAANATADNALMPNPPSPADTAAHDVVIKHQRSIKACLTKDMPAVFLRIDIDADGKATVVVKAKIDVPDRVRSCVTTAVQKMEFAPAVATVSLAVQR